MKRSSLSMSSVLASSFLTSARKISILSAILATFSARVEKKMAQEFDLIPVEEMELVSILGLFSLYSNNPQKNEAAEAASEKRPHLTSKYLSKYERARILGVRARQLECEFFFFLVCLMNFHPVESQDGCSCLS